MATTHYHYPSSEPDSESGTVPCSILAAALTRGSADYRLLTNRATGAPVATAVLNQRPGVAYRHGPDTGPLAEWGVVEARTVLVVTNPEMARHLVAEILARECDDCGAPTPESRLAHDHLAGPALRCDECAAAHHATELAGYTLATIVTCSHCGATWAAGEVTTRGRCGSSTLGFPCPSETMDGFDVDDLASVLATSPTDTGGPGRVRVEYPY